MAGCKCIYYSLYSGRMPVKDFIDLLDDSSISKFDFMRSLLEEFGRGLRQPYAKYVGNNLFELRFSGIEGAIRILYFFHKDEAVLTNGFIKKSKKIPNKELKLTQQRRRAFIENEPEEK